MPDSPSELVQGTLEMPQQVPPLRYAPVGMTLLFGNAKSRSQVSVIPAGA